MWFRSLPLLTLCLLLASCGFQLRGTAVSDIDAVRLTATAATTDLAVLVREELQIAGINLGADSESAINVQLLDERSQRRSVSTSALADAAQFELRIELDVALPSGVLTLLVERIYSVDSLNLTGSFEEQNLLLAEMRRDLARQLLRLLQAEASGG